MRKVIFLDFDGVLNCETTTDRVPHPLLPGRRVYGLDNDKVRLISSLAEKTGSDIVISSTWREMHTQDELEKLLRSRGLSGSVKIIGTTPVMSTFHGGGQDRGREISAWLSANQDVTKYLVIDDLRISGHQDNQIVTDELVGFGASDMLRAYEILSGS